MDIYNIDFLAGYIIHNSEYIRSFGYPILWYSHISSCLQFVANNQVEEWQKKDIFNKYTISLYLENLVLSCIYMLMSQMRLVPISSNAFITKRFKRNRWLFGQWIQLYGSLPFFGCSCATFNETYENKSKVLKDQWMISLPKRSFCHNCFFFHSRSIWTQFLF